MEATNTAVPSFFVFFSFII